MGQGIGLNNQASVTLSATVTLPSNSANWTFYTSVLEQTDDSGGGIGPVQIVTSDGSTWVGGGFPSSFTVSHASGTPFVVSFELSDFVAEADSSNNLWFDLRMIDPIAAPEPRTLVGVLLGLTAVLAFGARRFVR